MKGLKLIVTAAVIAAVAASYIAYAAHMRLDEPVFLTHYYDMQGFFSGRTIRLNYITNRSDNREVTAVTFPEAPDLSFSNPQTSTIDTYWHHKANMVFIQTDVPYGTVILPTTLTTAHVEFSDGTAGDFDIGQIIVENKPEGGKRLMMSRSVGKSNTGETAETFTVFEDCRLTDIAPEPGADTGADISIKINGDDFTLPVEFGQSESVTFDSVISVDDESAFNVYGIDKTLALTDTDGETYYSYLSNIGYEPDFSNREIRKLLKQRGVV